MELVDIHHRRHFRIADGEPADLARRIEIPLHRTGRDEKQVGDVVESAADVVCRKQHGIIHFFGHRGNRKQIADRILILGTAQAMKKRHRAGIRFCGCSPVKLRFQECQDGIGNGFLRARRPCRGHRRRPQLADDFLPDVRRVTDA